MIRINPIEWDEKILKEYIYKKDGTPKTNLKLLDDNYNFVIDRINFYKNNIFAYKVINKINYTNNELYEKLKKIYDSESENIKSLKSKIRKITETTCPYCALQINPYELDHFLPRSFYPEYSILTLNLIPSCSECNNKLKNNIYKTKNNLRAFIHPYYDEIIENKCFVQCNLSVYSGNLLEINFTIQESTLNNDEKEIVLSHFEKLNLYDRYKKFTNLAFEKFYKRFVNNKVNPRVFKDKTIEEIKERIEEEIDSLIDYNCNYYLKVFWKSFKDCEECIKLITDKKIPLGN